MLRCACVGCAAQDDTGRSLSRCRVSVTSVPRVRCARGASKLSVWETGVVVHGAVLQRRRELSRISAVVRLDFSVHRVVFGGLARTCLCLRVFEVRHEVSRVSKVMDYLQCADIFFFSRDKNFR